MTWSVGPGQIVVGAGKDGVVVTEVDPKSAAANAASRKAT